MRKAGSAGLIVLALAAIVQASDCPPQPPAYKYLRADEDYSYLRNPECRVDALDDLKFIPLDSRGQSYLSLGGEVREDMEYFNNASWGKGPQGPAYLLERYMGSMDLHAGSHFRLYGQLKSGLENGRTGGPRKPIDEDKLDINQAFVDFSFAPAADEKITFRAGRQEMAYGVARFVSVRDGPNVHQTFDALKVIFTVRKLRIDAFVSKPVQTNFEEIDDYPDPPRTFWGLYGTSPLRWPGAHLDVYYFGLRNSKAKFQQGGALEERHSIGTRFWGNKGAWDYDVEPVLQFGSFGRGDIRAWAVESEAGYKLRRLRYTPRLGFRPEIDSGDGNPANRDLQTFNLLFARGLYHQLVNLNGHQNAISLAPVLTFYLSKRLTVSQDCSFLWRENVNDGLYGVGGNLLRPGTPQQGRYIATQPTSLVDWKLQRHVAVILIYTHSFPGEFVRQSGPGRPVNYVNAWVDFKF